MSAGVLKAGGAPTAGVFCIVLFSFMVRSMVAEALDVDSPLSAFQYGGGKFTTSSANHVHHHSSSKHLLQASHKPHKCSTLGPPKRARAIPDTSMIQDTM